MSAAWVLFGVSVATLLRYAVIDPLMRRFERRRAFSREVQQ